MFPRSEREELINELYSFRTLIPNAKDMELSELRDHVQAVRHKTMARASVESKLFVPGRKHSIEETAGALREFVSWRRRRTGGVDPWPRGKRRAGALSGAEIGPVGVER